MEMNLVRKFKIPDWGIVAIAMVLILGTSITAAVWVVNRQKTVMSSDKVGRAITAQFVDGLTVVKTSVETERGVYLVYGAFQITKGSLLELQERKNHDRFLCVIGTQDCKKLVD